MGQDQVSGGVSVLCWLAAPVAMFYGNLQNSVIRSKSVLKSSSVISSQIGVMSDQLRVSLHMVMSQNVMQHLGDGDFIMFDEIPISTIKLSEGRFQTFNQNCLHRVIDITSFEKHLERFLDHTLNFYRNLVIFRSKNICQKESLTRFSTVIKFTN